MVKTITSFGSSHLISPPCLRAAVLKFSKNSSFEISEIRSPFSYRTALKQVPEFPLDGLFLLFAGFRDSYGEIKSLKAGIFRHVSSRTDPGKGWISECSSIFSAATGITQITINPARIVTSNPLLARIFNLPFLTEKKMRRIHNLLFLLFVGIYILAYVY
jgi:hypothetical protein